MAERRLQIPLEPVDSLTVTTLVDNVFDVFMPDQGPAHRASPATANGTLPTATMIAGVVPDQLIAEHGLSLLLTVTKGQQSHRLLFDTGVSPDGMIRRMGPVRLPVLIHPDFWNRRRVRIPGREPREIPTTSRKALQGAGFEIIEERQPSFLFDNSVLVTGEVDRTTGYEPGFPVQDAWR